MTIFVVLTVPDFTIVTYDKHFKRFTRNVHYTCKLNLLQGKIFIVDSLSLIFLLDQIKEVDTSILPARSESHIVFPPVNTPYSGGVTLAQIVSWSLASVKVKHLDLVYS